MTTTPKTEETEMEEEGERCTIMCVLEDGHAGPCRTEEEAEAERRVYSYLPEDASHMVDTWAALSFFADYRDAPAILALEVGEEYADGHAIWQRRS